MLIKEKGITWKSIIIESLNELGSAHYKEINKKVEEIAIREGKNIPPTWEAIVRDIIESHSSDSTKFNGQDIFKSVEGLGKGVWCIRQ